MFPANLDHLSGDHARRPGSRQGTTVYVHMRMDVEQQSDHKLITPSGKELLVCGCRVAPLLSPWCAREEVPTEVNLNPFAGPRSCIRWHSDNEPVFGPQNLPKLIVSLSLGNSVEFMVRRRARGEVPSSIRLDHGDILVMDGLAQSENERRTVSGLQGPKVSLAYRWVTQHIAPCPLEGVVGCALPSCVQVEPSAVPG